MCVQVFTLPKVSAKMKLKLTAVDGSRVRRVGVAWFGSSRSEDYGESGLVVLTNQGDLHVVSLPGVKMQVQHPCVRREDVSGIASCVFTKHGQGTNTCTHKGVLFLYFFLLDIINRLHTGSSGVGPPQPDPDVLIHVG